MTWLLGTMAGVIVWCALLLSIGAFIRYGNPTDEVEAADWRQWEDETGPPEYEPDDGEAQRIAEMFADAAAEEDGQHGLR